MIASPMLNSKFSPSQTIGRSPVIAKKSIFVRDDIKKTVSPFINNNPSFKLNPEEKVVDDKAKVVNVNRKVKNIFKNIEAIDSKPKFFDKNKDEDLPVTSSTYTTGLKDNKYV
jgi:hypothetical protein